MFNQMLVGLIVFQLTYIGILGVKRFPFSVLLIIPLIITLCWAVMINRKFGQPLRHLAVHTAADLDRADLVRALPSRLLRCNVVATCRHVDT